MAFPIPTHQDLLEDISARFAAEVEGADPYLEGSPEAVLSAIQAELAKGNYGYLSWVLRQLFPDTAENQYFWQWAAVNCQKMSWRSGRTRSHFKIYPL